MAKTVTLKATTVLGKDFTIMDSMGNIKKINEGIKQIYKRIDALDQKKETVLFAEYNEVITDEVVKQVAKLLDLSKDDAKKLEDMSYNDLFTFYSTTVNEFTGMTTPSVREMQKRQEQAMQALSAEDPKQDSED
ncbi:hypothetical protein [Limosilactobacillus reuteri]|uniref:hypothetical protein n=1 Tax=Limosilactobacillus reuteri TaxID=1598 RepID=UPI00081BED7A|nr:hypothetical protein [Limosilactobacillus reuteri]OCW61564.1 hypothetical protein BBP11_02535 [Limosilactobacillus reuteri]OCW63103.1 hypothetical protein BBP10_06825 [Limosilactobacillus reuteri]OCW63314.1 hypothetical protein BBP12_07445 [Limosilactobacillus reuteri]OCW69039.1 hypothetical protein BBP13_06955 [Limosilactobacillus reuteri]